MFKKISFVILLLLTVFVLASCSSQETKQKKTLNDTKAETQNEPPADKIVVVHFHGTNQCWSCVTIGDYALETIKTSFPEEFENKIIEFKEINGELPENKNLVQKYQARGSSLYINKIVAGKDNIQEDTTVWRLVTNKNNFQSYFEDKLANLLGN